MIRVDVENYCHSCLDFNPDVTTPTRLLSDDGKTVAQTDTIIQCRNRKRCASIERYLEQRMKGEPQG